MKTKSIFLLLTVICALCACQKQNQAKQYSDELNCEAVTCVTNDVVNWQIREFYNMAGTRRKFTSADMSWENAIFLSAVCEWSWQQGDTVAQKWVRDIAKKNDYQLLAGSVHVYHADHAAAGMLYADLYDQDGNINNLHNTVARLQFIKNNPSQCNLYSDIADKTYYYKQRWSWCDALFMAPPTYARIAQIWNDPSLLEFMDREYHATTDYLLDTAYNFYYRDSNYFNKKEANGKPVFWGRGQGWVIAGLARMIPYLPEDWSGRQYYIDLYKKMIAALVSVQSPEGHWYVTMLDPESYPTPEMSSTGFITYALWWGLNEGLLDEATYLEPATKGWQALVRAVQPDGMLGYVQAVGEKPEHITADMTEVYGPAAMAFAAMEVLKWLDK